MEEDRKLILLKAAYDLLNQQHGSGYVLNILETTAVWDGAVCDGYCLMEEIKALLEDSGIEVAGE